MSGFMDPTGRRTSEAGGDRKFFPSESPSGINVDGKGAHSNFGTPIVSDPTDNFFSTVRQPGRVVTVVRSLTNGTEFRYGIPETTDDSMAEDSMPEEPPPENTTIHQVSSRSSRMTQSAKLGATVRDSYSSRSTEVASELVPEFDLNSSPSSGARRESVGPDHVQSIYAQWAERHPMAALVAARIPKDKDNHTLPDMKRALRVIAEPQFRKVVDSAMEKCINALQADADFQRKVTEAMKNPDALVRIEQIRIAVENKLDALKSTANWRSAFRQIAVMISIYLHSFALGGLVGIWMADKAPDCNQSICEPDNWKIAGFFTSNVTLAVFGEWMVTVAKYGDLGTQYVYPVNYPASDENYNVRDFFMDMSWLGFFFFHALVDGLAPAAPDGDKTFIPKMRVLTGFAAITLAGIASAGIRITGARDHVYLDGGTKELKPAQTMRCGTVKTVAGRAKLNLISLEQSSWTATKGYASDWWEGVKQAGINPVGRNGQRVWTGIAVRFIGGVLCQIPRILASLGKVEAREGNIGADFLLGVLWAPVVLRLAETLKNKCGKFNFEPVKVLPNPASKHDVRRDLKSEMNEATDEIITNGHGQVNGANHVQVPVRPIAGPAHGMQNVAPGISDQTPGHSRKPARIALDQAKVNGASRHPVNLNTVNLNETLPTAKPYGLGVGPDEVE